MNVDVTATNAPWCRMNKRNCLFALLLLIVLRGNPAFAMASTHPQGPIENQEKWPPGLVDVINRHDRVFGYWVNWDDIFHYRGNTDIFNDFLQSVEQVDEEMCEKVLIQHEGGGEDKNGVVEGLGAAPVLDWKFSVIDNIFRKEVLPAGHEYFQTYDTTKKFLLLIEVWSENVDFDQIVVPVSVNVGSMR